MTKWFMLFVLIVAVPVSAQTYEPTVSYELQIFNSGATVPLQVQPIPLASVTCGRPITPAPTGTVTNPTLIAFLAKSGDLTQCELTQAQFLLSLPLGVNYTGVVVAIGATKRSPSAASNPFTVASAGPRTPSSVVFR